MAAVAAVATLAAAAVAILFLSSGSKSKSTAAAPIAAEVGSEVGSEDIEVETDIEVSAAEVVSALDGVPVVPYGNSRAILLEAHRTPARDRARALLEAHRTPDASFHTRSPEPPVRVGDVVRSDGVDRRAHLAQHMHFRSGHTADEGACAAYAATVIRNTDLGQPAIISPRARGSERSISMLRRRRCVLVIRRTLPV